MFGLPPGNPLREVVVELTRDHFRDTGEMAGLEPPLLRLLEVAIKADTSGASGGSGRSKSSAPLDVTAFSLWEEIREVVNLNWPGHGNLAYQNTLLIDRLTWWTNTVAATENEKHLLEYCVYWRKQIRELLDPPKKIELRGTKCPTCKNSWVQQLSNELDTTYVPAMLVHMSEDPVRAECLACGENWMGFDMIKEAHQEPANV